MRIATTLAACLLLLGCVNGQAKSEAPGPPPIASSAPRRTVGGVLKSIPESKKYVLIAHEDIPGFMKAMTMDFELLRPSQLDGLAPGDAITFTFVETEDHRLFIESIAKR
jgi:Cu/Ag efflux protein CusF